jgi:transposase
MSTPKKKTPAKKTAVKKSAPVKSTSKKSAPSKVSAATSREEKAAEKTIELLDEAARVLRASLRTGAKATAEGRTEAKQKAHSLVTKASDSLSSVLDEAGSILHKAINKTLGGK